MLLERDRQIAKIFYEQLEKMTPILELKIFGSQVREDFTEESDLDIFIKLPQLDKQLRYQISDLAWEIGFENDRIISTFVTTETQVQYGAQGANPLLAQIAKEGVEV